MTTLQQLKQLVGNPRSYALMRDEGGYLPVRKPLTPGVLKQHLDGDITIGTYVNHGDKAKTLVFDVDNGEDLELSMTETNAIVMSLHEDLDLPMGNIGVEFSGSKGYHVWVVFPTYVQAAKLRQVGRAVLTLTGVDCEVFPKQDVVRGATAEEKADDKAPLGNLVKLPMGIHKKTGVRAEFNTPFPRATPPSWLAGLDLPEAPPAFSSQAPEAFHCMETIQDGITEGGRNNSLTHLAVMFRRGGVSREYREDIVHRVNDKCDPPLAGAEVSQLLNSAEHIGPLCNHLDDETHCGDNCVLRRIQGLYTRPGQLKNAAVGEHVVVEVKARKPRVIELGHVDLQAPAKGPVK